MFSLGLQESGFFTPVVASGGGVLVMVHGSMVAAWIRWGRCQERKSCRGRWVCSILVDRSFLSLITFNGVREEDWGFGDAPNTFFVLSVVGDRRDVPGGGEGVGGRQARVRFHPGGTWCPRKSWTPGRYVV